MSKKSHFGLKTIAEFIAYFKSKQYNYWSNEAS